MRAILFDLDGTLLDIDIDSFLERYFGALGPVVAKVTGDDDPAVALDAVMRATRAMMVPHPGLTNREAFDDHFASVTGADIRAARNLLEEFYACAFPALRDGIGPHEGAREAVLTAIDLGFQVAVATNPIFPAAAISERIRWAGLDDVTFGAVTTYEGMHACKPDAEYFVETAELLGVPADECLMVGDDPQLDMPAAATGMSTFYVGTQRERHGDFRGSLWDLAAMLPSLADGRGRH